MFRFCNSFMSLALLSPDAAGGGSSATTPPSGAPAESEKRDSTVTYATLDALKAATPPKTYRRYRVVGSDGKEGFAIARQPREAVGAIALSQGWSVENIDRATRALSQDDVGVALEKMTPEARQALLAKYLVGGAPAVTLATTSVKPGETTTSPASTTNTPRTTVGAGAAGGKSGNKK